MDVYTPNPLRMLANGVGSVPGRLCSVANAITIHEHACNSSFSDILPILLHVVAPMKQVFNKARRDRKKRVQSPQEREDVRAKDRVGNFRH